MNIEECPSPNYWPDPDRRVKALIIHATATPGIESPKGWLCDPKAGASAHWLVGRDGRILRLVPEEHIAWHAGVSEWRGLNGKQVGARWRAGLNPWSVGFELVNDLKEQDYPLAQRAAAAGIVAASAKRWGLRVEHVVGHEDIAPGRKFDPGPKWPWGEFRDMLADLGVPA